MRSSSSPVSLVDVAQSLPDLWSPRVVAEVGTAAAGASAPSSHLLKVVRVAGEFPWHTHDAEDELFLVLQGTFTVGRSPADGGPVTLQPGECFVVPRGLRHNTSTPAGAEALIALFEPASTLHTGTEITPLTRSLAEQRQPLPGEPSGTSPSSVPPSAAPSQ